MVGGLTLLLLILPWLPPKRTAKDDLHLMVRPDNRIIPARPGETILEAVLREGIAFPYECRNGGCGQCKCTVSYGSVEQGPHQESALSAAERAKGVVLACSTTPLSDIELEYVPQAPPGGIRPREYRAKVVAMHKATDDVMIVKLKVERRPDSLLSRPVHQHPACPTGSGAAFRSPPRRMSTTRSNCRSA